MKFFKLFLAGLLIHGMGSCSVAVAGPGDTRIRADYVDGQDSSRNYIKDGDAETGTAVKGWTCYNDSGEGATTSPVNGTGGTPNVTFTKTTSSPLENNNSFVFTKDSANRIGQGCSYDFTIDARLKSKMLQITFDNLVGSGTFAAGSDTTNSDVMVYLYDITNSKLVPLQGQTKFYSNSTTLSEPFRAWYQAAPDSVNYRLILHVASTSASAFTLKSDVFKVSESKQVVGTIITEWQSYTTVVSGLGSGSTQTLQAQYMRVGPEIFVKIFSRKDSTAGTGSSTVTFSLPAGLQIDTSITQNGSILNGSGGKGSGADSIFIPYQVSSTTIGLFQNDSTVLTGSEFGANQAVFINFSVPILGWSAGARMSDGYDGRDLTAKYTGATATLTSSYSNVTFTTKVTDKTNSYSGSTFTAPSAKTYNFSGQIFIQGTAALNNVTNIRIFKNGTTALGSIQHVYAGAVTASVGIPFNFQGIELLSGETVVIQAASNITSPVISADSTQNYLAITAESGTPFMSPTAISLWRYSTAAGQSIPGSSAISIVDFGTKVIATGGNVTTGASWKFTPDQPGFYRIRGSIAYGANTFVSGNFANLLLYKTGSLYSQLDYKRFDATSGGGFIIGGMDVVELTTSDYIDLRTQHNNASSQPMAAADNQNYIIIERIK